MPSLGGSSTQRQARPERQRSSPAGSGRSLIATPSCSTSSMASYRGRMECRALHGLVVTATDQRGGGSSGGWSEGASVAVAAFASTACSTCCVLHWSTCTVIMLVWAASSNCGASFSRSTCCAVVRSGLNTTT